MQLKPLHTTIALCSFLLLGAAAKAQIITTIAGNGSSAYNGDLGAATSAAIGQPGNVAMDHSGNLYISDGYNNVIRKVTPLGIITTYAGNGTQGYAGDLGPATSAKLNYPQGIALDTAGNLYIADDGNFVVRKVATDGTITTIAGIAGSPGYSGDLGPATGALLYGALGIATDKKGDVFFSDGNYAVRKIDASGTITTYAGSLGYGYSGDGGPATAATMANPAGIALDDTGTMYIADNQNNVIRRVDTFGTITTLAGDGYLAESGGFPPTGAYAGDGGPAIDAELNEPYGVAADKWGNVYIADQSNNVIRKVDITQTITTLVGNGYNASLGYGGYTGDSGLATNAELNFPQDVIIDTAGNLYIADLYNYVVRKVAGISVVASADTVCSGTAVTYTAVATMTSPELGYQWKLNGTNVGTNSTAYAADSVHNGDIISCQLIDLSSGNAVSVSDSIIMVVATSVYPSVSISSSSSYTVCAGTGITYTATPVTGGSVPSYQWKVNGVNVGIGGTTYTYVPANGDVVTTVLTSNAACILADTAISSPVTMVVNPLVAPAVSIASTATAAAICAGSTITYSATPTNGGTIPAYVWKVNGIDAGTGNTYSYAPVNGDIVTNVLTSNAACATPDSAISAAMIMTVTPISIPAVSTTESATGSICAGSSVTYNATPENGGTTPTYQWKVNGTDAGTGASYTYTPANGDQVTCVLTSDAACTVPDTAISAAITMTVTPDVTPEVVVTANPGTTIIQDENVIFTATVVNGGSAPVYEWYINGTLTGATGSTFAVDTFTTADTVYCVVTSNASCALPATVTSNRQNIQIELGVSQISAGASEITLLPNPNNGIFTIKGYLGVSAETAADIVVTDILGKVVYHSPAPVMQGNIDSSLAMNSSLVNGVYLISIKSGNTQSVLRFVITK